MLLEPLNQRQVWAQDCQGRESEGGFVRRKSWRARDRYDQSMVCELVRSFDQLIVLQMRVRDEPETGSELEWDLGSELEWDLESRRGVGSAWRPLWF